MKKQSTYNINHEDRMLISSMSILTPAPALILQTPPFGNVGEDSLIQEICDLVYKKTSVLAFMVQTVYIAIMHLVISLTKAILSITIILLMACMRSTPIQTVSMALTLLT